MKIDDFRRGVVRICDEEAATRGTGFFVSQAGHVLTCDHVVQVAQQLTVKMADGRKVPATLAPELSLPELDLAVLNTNVAPDFVVPVEFAGATGDPVWTSGFQMQGSVSDALPTFGRIAGQTGLQYAFGERTYKLPEVLRLENALVKPGLSGALAVLERDLVAIGLVNAELNNLGGFILPFHAIKDQACGLYKLLQQNRQTTARYGKYLNWPAFRELCQKSSAQVIAYLETSGRYLPSLFVKRDAVNSVLERFLLGSARILPIVGQTGTGKTNYATYVTETLKEDFPIVLLLAYRLSPHPDGLAATLAAHLAKASPDVPAFSFADLSAAISTNPAADLILILDGLNELPGTIKAAREWLESTCDWLRANNGIRLIVTCRPEYWNSAKNLFASDLLFTDLPAASRDDRPPTPQPREFQLGEFTEAEAEEASRLYGLPIKEGVNIFRHPLFYNIARKALAGGTMARPSIDRLFHDYIDALVNEICSDSAPSRAFPIRSTLDRLASTLRANKSLWIDRTQLLNASPDPSIGGVLLGEHLLVEGEGGVRFAFDETAHYLVAQVASREFEKATTEGIDWIHFQQEDPIGADSMSFFLASLEARGKTDSVAKILNALAVQSHPDDHRQAYFQHTLFLRLLQWLRAPSAYFPAMLTFVESCTRREHHVGLHSLSELIELSGMAITQQMQLLLIIARKQYDRYHRWKDWEHRSESEFWNDHTYGPGITQFRLALKNVLDRDPDTTIALLLEWTKDESPLHCDHPPAEATVSDVACSILYHTADHRLEPIVEGLARIHEFKNAGHLLYTLARKYPVEMLDLCERWARSGEFSPAFVATKVGTLLSMGPDAALTARLAAILDRLLQQADSPELTAAVADSLSLHPSTASRALELADELMQKDFPVDPWLLNRLVLLDPDRVCRLLDSIIVHSTALDRREWAVSAFEKLAQLPGRALTLLSVVESYLARYPELSHRLACAVEKLLYSTKLGTPEGDAVDAWVRANYSRFSSNVPIIYGVIARAEKDPSGTGLLRTIISETPEESLATFLSLLPKTSLPMETRLELLIPVAQRIDEKYPFYESMLSAIIYSMDDAYGSFLAETVAKDPTRWPRNLVEYSNRVRAGARPFDTAHQISMRELDKQRPQAG